MSRRIEHRAEFGHPVDLVYAVLTDEGFLRERLTAIGGRSVELVSYAGDQDGMKAVTRQGIDAQHLPGAVRKVAPGGMTIERTETWDGGGNGRYRGTVDASVGGFPGSLRGNTALRTRTGGSELLLDGTVKVSIPLLGGKIEDVIIEQVGRLLRLEAEFAIRWLETHRG